MANKKFVVYTCITGGYDVLREVKFKDVNADYVCFTDNAALQSKTWKVVPIPEAVSAKTDSAVKKQRLVKILAHEVFPEYDVSLWVDSNVEIIGDLKDFFVKYDLTEKFLHVNKHPSRDCIYREQLAVARLGKDTFENTAPQINRYRDEGFPEHFGLAETNILLRAHNDKRCVKLMDVWASEVLAGSHRDQLSFDYAVWKTGFKNQIGYLWEKYYNLRFSDSAFFLLKKHRRDENYKQISVSADSVGKHVEIVFEKGEVVQPKPLLQIPWPERSSGAAFKARASDPSFKRVAVAVFTHDRTAVAVETLKSLFKNLKYPNLKWVLTDDRSKPGHLDALDAVFKEFGVDYELCETGGGRFGLGAAMNIALKKCFAETDVVLRVEDDWMLERELDLKKHVDALCSDSRVSAIRLSMVGGGVCHSRELWEDKSYKALTGLDSSAWIFVNQVMLVHKRVHDELGWYLENVSADLSEREFKDRFNKAFNNGRKRLVLVPSEMKWRTFDDPSLWFIHVGRSTLGHVVYREPKRYSWLYAQKNVVKKISSKLLEKTAKEKTELIKEEEKEEKKRINSVCVYTCITGNYDTLKSFGKQDPSIDFICFTDSSYIKAHPNGWIVKDIPKDLRKFSKVKQQRLIKILPNVYLSEYSVSIWVDAVFSIVGDMKSLIEKTIRDGCSVYVRRHPDRKCAYEEAKAVVKLRKDNNSVVSAQMSNYRKDGFPINFGLTETNIILRKHNSEDCVKTMQLWAQEVLNWSHRDQLSFEYCVWKQSLKTNNFSLVQEKFKNGYIEKRSSHNPSIVFYSTNFNTSQLENALIKSIMKNVSGWNYKIIVIDNSNKIPFKLDRDIDESFVEIIDNTKEKVIPTSSIVKKVAATKSCNNYASLRHAITIQWIIDNCNVDKFVLFDSDVILKKNIDFIDSKTITAAGIHSNGVKTRFTPFIQYFNVSKIKEKKLKFLDVNRMHGGSNPLNSGIYDTGASFYEDVVREKIGYKLLNNNDYIEHLGGGSGGYRQHKRRLTPEEFLEKNKKYYK